MINIDQLLAEINSKGKLLIKEWIDQGYREDLHLDFKCKSSPSTPAPNDFDRKNYSKALSGFSNSDGGILVWGVEAPGSGNSQRYRRPIKHVRAFAEHLDSLVSRLVNPSVQGVINTVIFENKNQDTGYVVSYIPRSSRAPHRAEADGLKHYYKRYGDSFKPIEHYELEYMFGLRSAPDLGVFWGAEGFNDGSNSGNIRCFINIGITNYGREIAKYPCLRLRFDKTTIYKHDVSYEPSLIYYSTPTRGSKNNIVVVTARVTPGLVIYPEDHMIFFVFNFDTPLSSILTNTLPSFNLSYDLFSQHFKSLFGQTLKISGKKICENIKRKLDLSVSI